MPVIGTQQSPIRIVHNDTISAKLDPLTFAYAKALPGKFSSDNFVFTVQYQPDGGEVTFGKVLHVGSASWVIRKIHIHAPAEHTFNEDEPADFECHLLHSLVGDIKGRGPKLVVGVFFKVVGKATKKGRSRSTMFGLNTVLRDAAKDGGEADCKIEHPHDIDVSDFLPDKDFDKFYRYEGSLTSEPFSEDVTWYVLKHRSEVFENNVDQILKCADQEARPVHAIDRRYVLRNFS